jgi:N-acetylglucosamine-6-phosphate deacetylase
MWAPGRFGVQNGRIQGLELGTATASIKSAKSVESMRHFAPGLIDLHVHGFGGWGPVGPMDEFRERGEGEHSSLERMAAALARAGTTAFLPTLFPEAPAALNQTVQRTWRDAVKVNQATHAHRPRGAQVLGLHLEGPFVNPMAAGALPLVDLAEPSVAALRTLLAGVDAAAIRTLTLAPELAGATDLVRELTTMGLRVSFGHSRAQAADVRALLQRYPSTAFGITHLFNAMSGVHHREPGLAHLALCDDSVYAEMIGDLVHVGREGFELALRARGPEHLCLVSDALAGAGTGCDVFHSHGRKHVIRGGAAYYPGSVPPAHGVSQDTAQGSDGLHRTDPKCAQQASGDQLAGSATGQWEAIQRLVGQGIVALADALTMATLAPARALQLESERGVLIEGAVADVLEIDTSGKRPRLSEVWIAGQPIGVQA